MHSLIVKITGIIKIDIFVQLIKSLKIIVKLKSTEFTLVMTVWWMGIFAGVYELPEGLTESSRRDCSLKLNIFYQSMIVYEKNKNNGT